MKTRTSDITKSCVFLQLNLSRMGDKRGVSSDDIEVNADKDIVKVRKVIFQSPRFDQIKSLDSEVRRFIRRECLPFEPGIHLVPLRYVETIDQRLKFFQAEREERVKIFADIYPDLVKDIQPRLRALYNDKDYLEAMDVAEQFSMSWQFLMFTSPTELAGVSAEIFQAEREKMTLRMEEAFEEARLVLRQTMVGLVSHLRESLQPDIHGGQKRLSASTLKHLQEFLDTFDLKNVTDDTELQKYIGQAKKALNGVEIEALRTTDGLRINIASSLSEIEQSITKNLEIDDQPKRRIRRA